MRLLPRHLTSWSGELHVTIIQMSEYKISIETEPDSKQVDFLHKQLHEFNVGKIRDY